MTKALGVQALLGLSPVVALQPMYNLLKRQAESEILPMARSERLAVFPYSPLAGGLLSGKCGPGKRPQGGGVGDNARYGTRYGAAANFDIAGRFTQLAAEAGRHPVALAVAWVAGHPAVTAPLLGARDVEQLRPALTALDEPLDDDLRARISALSPEPPPATDRNEERSAHNYGRR